MIFSGDYEPTMTSDPKSLVNEIESGREVLRGTEPTPPDTAPREMTPDLPPTTVARNPAANRGRGYDNPRAVTQTRFAAGASGRVRRNAADPA